MTIICTNLSILNLSISTFIRLLILGRVSFKKSAASCCAQRLINENLSSFTAIPLTADDYQKAISLMVRLNLPGRGIFDTIIAQAALKAKADTILTLNPNHFTRLGKDIGQKVKVSSA